MSIVKQPTNNKKFCVQCTLTLAVPLHFDSSKTSRLCSREECGTSINGGNLVDVSCVLIYSAKCFMSGGFFFVFLLAVNKKGEML